MSCKSCDEHGHVLCGRCYEVLPSARTEMGARVTVARYRQQGIAASMIEAHGAWYIVLPRP